MSAKKAISVLASTDKFRRAGINFSRVATVLLLADLDKAQIAAIEAEPRLTVTEVAAKSEKAQKPASTKTSTPVSTATGDASSEGNTTSVVDGDGASANQTPVPVATPATSTKKKTTAKKTTAKKTTKRTAAKKEANK